MATDSLGNPYVLCLCVRTDGSGFNDYGVFEFGPTANGNVAPIRFVTTPGMYRYFYNDGVGVDSVGTIYVQCRLTVQHTNCLRIFSFRFRQCCPSNTVVLSGWTDAPSSRIAVH